MERVIVHFKDENAHFINIAATDIFERDEYLHIYNGNDLVGIILASTVKVMYKSIQGG
jgi:hypothetical protein